MIPGYVVADEVFRGRKRVVSRGVREKDEKPVILKTLTPDYPSDSAIAGLRREYDIIRNLSDDGIVQALAFVDERNRQALVLEDIGGRTLKLLIERQEIDFITALEIAAKLTKAIAAVHDHQIIHKDINPKNVIVNLETKQVQLIDFSISSRLPRQDQKVRHPVFLEGTLAYMSPEQTGRMNRSVDYRTDFYSLGVTLYEMLTARLPFETHDPMELVHCHLAREPSPPTDLNPAIPAAVSSIVLKMLAKTAEDRYQSARGIHSDLQLCIEQWSASKSIPDFAPAAHDIRDRFQVPQKLYGREQETATLLAGFDRVAEGATEMLLVTGYSGVGKSALVREIDKPIAQKRGYFVSGKFDQRQRTVPYSAIVGALRELMRQLLTESEAALAGWKEKLSSAVGVNGQIIVDVIPEIEWIIGPQPPVAELEPTQAENRFKHVFQKFVRVFCGKAHPLVVFLDDLQWADPASLKLMGTLLTDEETGFFYLLGAYRNNEVGPTHPLTMGLARLKEDGAVTSEIVLAPLGLQQIGQLIAETFDRDDRGVERLAQLVLDKTDGNPFFLRQFLRTLYDEGLIAFDPSTLAWTWDLASIESTDITNNVVDLMVRKLKQLSDSARAVLQLAACIGNRFDLNSLSIIHERSTGETSRALWPAIQHRLILPTSEYEEQVFESDAQPDINNPREVTFAFLHDRVQQAAYALIEPSRRKVVHAKIGKLLLENLVGEDQHERLFELVDHLNLGRELLTRQEESLQLAQLNLRAGIRAKEATAYDAARDYLAAGMRCLSDDMWVATYALSFELHKELAETEYLMGRFESSQIIIDELLRRAKTAVERAEVYNMLVVQRTLNGEYAKAIATGRQALAELGIDLPAENLQTVLKIELERAKQSLGDREVGSLLHAPDVESAETAEALKLLASMAPLCYIADPELCRVIAMVMVNISLKQGHTADSVLGYAFYGLVLSSVVRDFQAAYQFGQLAIGLSEKFKSSAHKCRATHVFACFINHWSRHLSSMIKINEDGFQAGLESGELQFAGYHCYNRAVCLFYMGRNLHALLPELEELKRFSQKTRNQNATDPITAVQLVALNLTGQSETRLTFNHATLDDGSFQDDLLARRAMPAFTHYNVLKSFPLYLHGQWHDALECIQTSKDRLAFISGHFATASQHFYHALILTALHQQASSADQTAYRMQLKEIQVELNLYAASCPENFRHRAVLVDAEVARLDGDLWQASVQYDQAIEGARKGQFIHEEALANELAGRFYQHEGREKLAKVYLVEARNLYRDWGAATKVNGLEESYPRYLVDTALEPMPTIATTMTHDLSTGTGRKSLDFRTAIKAAQAISGEIVLTTLLKKLIGIVIENAGAQKGFLLLEREAGLFIEAVGTVNGDDVALASSAPLESSGDPAEMPLSIINYVKRTRESKLIADAARDSQFASDGYIQRVQPKSILCMPIVDKGDLVGILYLENNLVAGAFKPERLEVMQILASQSAISLQNARLFEERRRALEEVEQLTNDLETRVRVRTTELSRANDLLAARNEDLRRRSAELEAVNRELDAFASAVSHDLRSPLRGIRGFSQMLSDDFHTKLGDKGDHYLDTIQSECARMSQIIDDLLALSRVSGGQLTYAEVNLSEIAESIASNLRERDPHRSVDFDIASDLMVQGDPRLLRIALENLIGNAWKFTSKKETAKIEIGRWKPASAPTYYVRDDGAGFPGSSLSKLFRPFQRLHSDEFEGNGVGLATVQRILHRHGGAVCAEGRVGHGATFYFTLSE